MAVGFTDLRRGSGGRVDRMGRRVHGRKEGDVVGREDLVSRGRDGEGEMTKNSVPTVGVYRSRVSIQFDLGLVNGGIGRWFGESSQGREGDGGERSLHVGGRGDHGEADLDRRVPRRRYALTGEI